MAAMLLVAMLAVNCGGGGGGGTAPASDTNSANTPPVANAGPDQVGRAGDTVTLDGSASHDADNDQLAYAWAFVSKPAGSAAALSDRTAVGPTFTPDEGGFYVLSLTVNDGTVDSAADTVTIDVKNLPDTGQTGNYTTTFGEDSDYTINPPSYTDNGNGTVTDNVTGLMWQQQDDGNTYNWYEATGAADATSNPGGATDVCGNASTGGYNDWRLPTKKELLYIVDYGIYIPASDRNAFPNAHADKYWSATTVAGYGGSSYAWNVDFYYGYAGEKVKTDSVYVRCVRGNSSISANNFQDNNDDTVTDTSTGLMWQKTEGGSKNWDQALSYCEGLTLAGHSDWRLPNIKELESLTDDSRYLPAIDTVAFPGAHGTKYWSATAHVTFTSYAWYVGFDYGYVDYYYGSKMNSLYVRCVR